MTDQRVAESDFLSDWKNQLPEEWRKHTALSALRVMHSFLLQFFFHVLIEGYLQCKYARPSKGTIAFGIGLEDDIGPVVANGNGKRPGKWHERFKSTRR